MSIAPPEPGLTLTLDEYESSRAWKDHELVRGELQRVSPASGKHGFFEIEIAFALRSYLQHHPCGSLYGGEAGFILSRNPDTVRGADVAYLVREKAQRVPDTGFVPFAPDLVVELVSPNDRYGEVMAKVGDWLNGGTQVVWVVDYRRKTVEVCKIASIRLFTESDVLTAEELLPGFSLPLSQLFASNG